VGHYIRGILGLALMALGITVIADLGFRNETTMYESLFFSISGILLAAESTIIMITFPEWMPTSYSIIVLAGSILILRGIHGVQGVKHLLKREQTVPDLIQP